MTIYLKQEFEDRLQKAISLINESGIDYEKLGIFGSYARGEATGSSDIDICLVVKDKPSRRLSGPLREDCELIGVDVIFVTEYYLKKDTSRFARKLREDWRCLCEK